MDNNSNNKEVTHDEQARIDEATAFAAQEMPYGLLDQVKARMATRLLDSLAIWIDTNPDMAEVIKNQQETITGQQMSIDALVQWKAFASSALENAMADIDTSITRVIDDRPIYERAALLITSYIGHLNELETQAALQHTGNELWAQAANVMNKALEGQPEGADTTQPLIARFEAYLDRVTGYEPEFYPAT